MRARGLKHGSWRYTGINQTSRPMRARGLKHGEVVQHLARDGRAPCGRVG